MRRQWMLLAAMIAVLAPHAALTWNGRGHMTVAAIAYQPPLPNFPHMLRGRNWHFINVPFSTAGTPLQPPRAINALGKIVEFRAALGDPTVPANIQAYDLAWLLHLVGDIH